MNRKLVVAAVAALAACLVVVAALTLPGLRTGVQHSIATRSADSAFHSHRLNLLLLGYQADEGNSDTVILAHLDIDQRTATLVSIPRDTWVAIPRHGHEKINAAIGFGGPAMAARVVSALTGAHIDATVAIQPDGAKQLVDAMGGMNVNVERDMDYDDNYGNLHIHLKKGEQYLTGGQVLGYVPADRAQGADGSDEPAAELGQAAQADRLGPNRHEDHPQRCATRRAARNLPRRARR